VIVIEHNLDVVKSADWIIDLGPEGGDRGGSIVAAGTPEEVAAADGSYTGEVLAPLLAIRRGRPKPASSRSKPKAAKRPPARSRVGATK